MKESHAQLKMDILKSEKYKNICWPERGMFEVRESTKLIIKHQDRVAERREKGV